MRWCSIVRMLYLICSLVTVTVCKKPPTARGYSRIDPDTRYMKIILDPGMLNGEHVRFLARQWLDVEPDDFDIIQIGSLEPDEVLEFSHGGGNFLPKFPFWFERTNYHMGYRIIHWPFEKKIEVSGKLHKLDGQKIVGIGPFIPPVEYYYQTESYYLDLVYVFGYHTSRDKFSHHLYLQGNRTFPFAHTDVTIEIEPSKGSTDFQQVELNLNTVEAYRNRIGKTSALHGDDDELIVQSMGGYPMPYHVPFRPGGLYLGQRAHFCGFFTGNVVAKVSTDYTTHEFLIQQQSVTYNSIKKVMAVKLYDSNDIFNQLGSISIINLGRAIAILFNVPHRFDFNSLAQARFISQMAQFDIELDGPITEVILTDEIGYTKRSVNDHDYAFRTMSHLQHVDIDNEDIQEVPILL